MGQKKRSLKIDPVLVCLGYAVKLCYTVKVPHAMYGPKSKKFYEEQREIKWKKKDGYELFSDSKGKKLWIIKAKRKTVGEEQFLKSVSKKRTTVDKALNLYTDWHETDPITGSVLDPPKGFLFELGRCESITYSSNKYTGRQQRYIHEFKTPPIVWGNNKRSPKVILLTGGKIAVKNEGITG
jgi:hypothetical protein